MIHVATCSAIEFYVSANGNDSNPGTLDKPFATLEKARDSLREIKSRQSFLPEGATVYVLRSRRELHAAEEPRTDGPRRRPGRQPDRLSRVWRRGSPHPRRLSHPAGSGQKGDRSEYPQQVSGLCSSPGGSFGSLPIARRECYNGGSPADGPLSPLRLSEMCSKGKDFS
jgi:hypothetical protein